jgi:glycosyltransferase involved in cell wall biosynthesis
VLLVEGSLMGGYEVGLEVAVKLAEGLSSRVGALQTPTRQAVELMVVGRVSPGTQQRWQQRTPIVIQWAGQVPQERIPEIDRAAHILYSADLNAACPNSVIEALACGLPVLAFDTGALPEMVSPPAGRVVPYGGDPWRIDPPDSGALIDAAVDILQQQETYRKGARQRAEEVFALDQMVQSYLQVLQGNPSW